MAFFLITGLGGAGKSALVYELTKRGHRAVDTDAVDGLTRWRNIRTGEVLDDRPPLPIDFQTHRFAWQDEEMLKLLSGRGTVFVCGGAWNARSFYPCFEHIFVVAPDKPQPKPKSGRPKRAGKPVPPAGETLPNIPGATALSGARTIPDIADEVLLKADNVKRPRDLAGLLRLVKPKFARLMMKLEARRRIRVQD